MGRLVLFAAAFGFCSPALAADAPSTPYEAGRGAESHCVRLETFYPTYPNWILSPDPFNVVIPQYYSVVSWVCDRERFDSPRAPRRHGRPAI
jgi:hypothetical protein